MGGSSTTSLKRSRRLQRKAPEMFHSADSGEDDDEKGVPTKISTTKDASTTAQDNIPPH